MDRQRRLQRHLDVLWATGGFLAAAADRKRPAHWPAARRAARRRRAPAADGPVAGSLSGRKALNGSAANAGRMQVARRDHKPNERPSGNEGGVTARTWWAPEANKKKK